MSFHAFVDLSFSTTEHFSMNSLAHDDLLPSSFRTRIYISTTTSQEHPYHHSEQLFQLLCQFQKITSQNIAQRLENENTQRLRLLVRVKRRGYDELRKLPEYSDDRQVVWMAVRSFPQALQFASIRLKSDREIVLQAVTTNGCAIEFAKGEAAKDREIFEMALKTFDKAVDYLNVELGHFREIVLKCVDKKGMSLKYACEEFRKDREIVRKALKQDGNALQFVSNELKNEREMIELAVNTSGEAIQFVENEEFLNDKQIILLALKSNPKALEFVPPTFSNDREFVQIAVSKCGSCFKFASKQLRDDFEMVQYAVQSDAIPGTNFHRYSYHSPTHPSTAFKFASERLRKDPQMVEIACLANDDAYQYADPSVTRNNKTLLLKMIEKFKHCYFLSEEERLLWSQDREIAIQAAQYGVTQLISPKFRYDRNFVAEVCKKSHYFLSNFTYSTHFNQEFWLFILQETNDYQIYYYIPNELKKDTQFISTALRICPSVIYIYSDSRYDELKHCVEMSRETLRNTLKFGTKGLELASNLEVRKDRALMLEACQHYLRALSLADESLTSDKEFLIQTFKTTRVYDRQAMSYIPDSLRNDREFVMQMVQANSMLLEFLPPEFCNDREIVLKAMKSCPNGSSFKFASVSLRKDREIIEIALTKSISNIDHVPEDIRDEIRNNFNSTTSTPSNNITSAATQWSLRYLNDEKRKQRDLVLKNISLNPLSLQYADDSLKNDKEVVMEAVKRNGTSLMYASNELKRDRQVAILACSSKGNGFRYVDPIFRTDREVVTIAVSNFGGSLELVEKEFGNDFEIVMKAVSNYGLALQFASEELQSNIEIVRAAIQQDPQALQFASECFKNINTKSLN
ncbi:hypothetical protein C9374_000443 [Naegleria lovaniensis]|uniref:DUF4116 domain-containing protein n=1 Tax=Naegleria lovaniensis TaxID=51637 RepID=A0AA88GZ00_NAELO|nr:uncharacterized protein C9374_000443 [Naegleria lovaniensis]KAG2388279.1 hypothetical protein C9374_000443 [Naegleria lovaniensis]